MFISHNKLRKMESRLFDAELNIRRLQATARTVDALMAHLRLEARERLVETVINRRAENCG